MCAARASNDELGRQNFGFVFVIIARIEGIEEPLDRTRAEWNTTLGRVDVEASLVAGEGVETRDVVRFEIRDTGPGIPPESQIHLFEQFYTARTSSRSHNIGAGLGLPIAKGIVEAHGGRIWTEASPSGGAAFRFTLPLEGPPLGAVSDEAHVALTARMG